MSLIRVNKKSPCPVCARPDWCSVDAGGAFAICMRVASERQARNGGWTHRLNADLQGAKAFTAETQRRRAAAREKLKMESGKSEGQNDLCNEQRTTNNESYQILCSPSQLDNVYQSLIGSLTLLSRHFDALRARGLSAKAIEANGFRSVPTPQEALMIARKVSQGRVLRGVPGFYFVNGRWRIQTYGASGFLIPIRDVRGNIVALQLRRDDARKPKYLPVSSQGLPKGTSPGAPHHFAMARRRAAGARVITITEGALKATIISELMLSPVVGLMSVSTFNEKLPAQLKEAFPILETARIAFDMDAYSNPAVLAQRQRLVKVLEAAEIKVKILTWDEKYKGLDDLLISSQYAVAGIQ